MQILDNVNNTLKDDLAATISKGDKLSIAAACFSIYAYEALKKQLEGIDELRFRSNVTGGQMSGFLSVVKPSETVAYSPLNSFTTSDL
ncbi:MAG: hypothetical protein ABFC85_08650, partial [Rectinema sp.]